MLYDTGITYNREAKLNLTNLFKDFIEILR